MTVSWTPFLMIRILILIPMFLVFSGKAIHTTNQTVTQDLFVKEYLQDRDKKKNLFSLLITLALFQQFYLI